MLTEITCLLFLPNQWHGNWQRNPLLRLYGARSGDFKDQHAQIDRLGPRRQRRRVAAAMEPACYGIRPRVADPRTCLVLLKEGPSRTYGTDGLPLPMRERKSPSAQLRIEQFTD
jgi:hypothetical protein